MAEIYDWNVLATNNNQPPPNGFPENMDYRDVNDAAREVMAVLARFLQAIAGTGTVGGTGNAYTLTVDQTLTGGVYAQGQIFGFFADRANTGDVTLNVDGIGAAAVLDASGNQLEAGIIENGGFYLVVRGTADFRIVGTQSLSGGGFALLNAANIFTQDQTIRRTGVDAELTLDTDENADNDVVAALNMQGHDSGGNDTRYGRIRTVIRESADGNEQGDVITSVQDRGTERDVVNVRFDETLVISYETGSTEGGKLNLRRDESAPPDDSILGSLVYSGRTDGGAVGEYAWIRGIVNDDTAVSLDSTISFGTTTNGTLVERVSIGPAGVTFSTLALHTANVNLQDNEIIRPQITDYSVTSTAPSISAGTLTLNLENSNDFDVSWDANITTLTVSNWSPTGNLSKFTLRLAMDGTARTIAWPAGWLWPEGTEPTTPAINQDLFVTVWSRNAGTTVYAAVIGSAFA